MAFRWRWVEDAEGPFPTSTGILLVGLLLAGIVFGLKVFHDAETTAQFSPAGSEFGVVREVVSGDTVMLESRTRVRLLGITAPPAETTLRPLTPRGRATRASGAAAREALQQLVGGRRVRLDFDYTRRDRFGRLLAYVHLSDGTFVNAELLRRGFVRVDPRTPFRLIDEFRALEAASRDGS